MASQAQAVVTLQDQLKLTQTALADLTASVEHLARSYRRNRRWLVAMGLLASAVAALALFTAWFAITTRADIQDFGERSFLTSCEARNEGRAADIRNIEALLVVTRADERDPILAAQIRQTMRENNPSEDCQAALDNVGA